MTNFDIIRWIVENKLAKNEYAAAHIANGLQLWDIHDDPEKQKERVNLYRAWRRATKDEPKKCYQYALDEKPAPQDMFGHMTEKEGQDE